MRSYTRAVAVAAITFGASLVGMGFQRVVAGFPPGGEFPACSSMVCRDVAAEI